MSFSVNAESQKISPPVRNIPCFSHFIVLDQCRCSTLILKSGHELVCLPVHVQTHLCYKRLLYVEIQHENNTETNSV